MLLPTTKVLKFPLLKIIDSDEAFRHSFSAQMAV